MRAGDYSGPTIHIMLIHTLGPFSLSIGNGWAHNIMDPMSFHFVVYLHDRFMCHITKCIALDPHIIVLPTGGQKCDRNE
jgi:hypothetical protein